MTRVARRAPCRIQAAVRVSARLASPDEGEDDRRPQRQLELGLPL